MNTKKTSLLRELQDQVLARMKNDPGFRAKAYRTASSDPVIMAALVRALKSEEVSTCSRALDTLSLMALDAANPYFPAIVEGYGLLLRYPNDSLRQKVARAIAEMGVPAVTMPEMQARLLHAVRNQSEDDEVRCWLLTALWPIARDPEVRSTLQTLAQEDPSENIRTGAQAVLQDTRSLQETLGETLDVPVEAAAKWLASVSGRPVFEARRIESPVVAATVRFEPPENEVAYEDIAEKEWEGIRYRLRQAKENRHRELVVETQLAEEDPSEVVVLILLQDQSLVTLGEAGADMLTWPPVYLLLSRQGNWAVGRIRLISQVGEPVSVVKVDPRVMDLTYLENLKRSCLAQIQDHPETLTAWRAWALQLPKPLRNTFAKDLPDELNRAQ